MKNKVVKKIGLYFGGNANNGANAGSFIANSYNAPTNANAYIGSRQYFQRIKKMLFQTVALAKKIRLLKMCVSKIKTERSQKRKQTMKRVGNLFDRICSIENLILAEKKARKGKECLCSYVGWAKHCDSRNLLKKLNLTI